MNFSKWKILYFFFLLLSFNAIGFDLKTCYVVPTSSGRSLINISSEKILVRTIFDRLSIFNNRLLIAGKNDGRSYKYGLINTSNEVILPFEYSTILNQRNDMPAAVQLSKNGKWGLVDEYGKILVECKYDRPIIFVNGVAVVDERGKLWCFTILNSKDKIEKHRLKGYVSAKVFRSGLLAVKNKENKWGFMDAKGDLKLECKWSKVSGFNSFGKCGVKLGGLWGIINKKGEFICKPKFELLMFFSADNYFAFKKNDKWGFVDSGGDIIINAKFEKVRSFNGHNVAPVFHNDQVACVNRRGGYVFEPGTYDGCNIFKNGYAVVRKGGNEGCINEAGDVVIPLMFPMILEVDDNGVTRVYTRDFHVDEFFYFDVNKQKTIWK